MIVHWFCIIFDDVFMIFIVFLFISFDFSRFFMIFIEFPMISYDFLMISNYFSIITYDFFQYF